ncbi:MAG: hypothetical protein ACYC0V_01265 [Armatimonadota bacterium]
MKAIITLIIIIFASISVLYADVSSPDSKLDKPVTLAIKGESLADIVQMMEKQTSVKLRVSKNIREQKATIFVDKMPLRNVIDGICVVFGYRFNRKSASSDIYEIWEPEKNWKTRADATIQSEADAWECIESMIEKGIAFSSMNLVERAKVIAQISSDTQDPELRELAELYESIEKYPISAMIIRSLSKDARIMTALRSRLSVHFDSRSTESGWTIPRPVLDGLPVLANDPVYGGLTELLSSLDEGTADKFTQIHLGISCNPKRDMRSITIMTILEYCRGVGFPSTSTMLDLVSADMIDRTPALVKLPQTGNPRYLDSKVSFKAEELLKEAELPDIEGNNDVIMVNRSDILALLHKHIGMQVISDHYSFWYKMSAVQNKSVAEVLEMFSRISPSLGNGMSSQEAIRGWNDRLLYMRIQQIALSDAREIPNAPLRRWRDVSGKHGCLGLDELAEIAWLSDNQINGLRQSARFYGIDSTPLYQLGTSGDLLNHVADNMSPLKLYGILNTMQKQQAFQDGTRVDSFTKEQYIILADMLNGLIKPDSRFKAGIYNGEIRVDKQDTGNQMQPVTMQISGTIGTGYQYNPSDAPAEQVIAETPEDAWRQVLAKHRFARKEELTIISTSQSYDFTLHMTDGATHVWSILINQKTLNYADWERAKKH